MSRAWIAFYMGDYDKDTQDLTTLEHGAYFLLLKHCWVHGRIPLEPAKRAAIARLTSREWGKIAATVDRFFDNNGTQKRASQEIEKAEIIRTKRAIAGFKGGTNSGISRAIQRGRSSKYEATVKQTTKQTMKQNGIQKESPAEASHNRDIITTTVSEDTAKGLGKGNSIVSPELAAILARKANA